MKEKWTKWLNQNKLYVIGGAIVLLAFTVYRYAPVVTNKLLKKQTEHVNAKKKEQAYEDREKEEDSFHKTETERFEQLNKEFELSVKKLNELKIQLKNDRNKNYNHYLEYDNDRRDREWSRIEQRLFDPEEGTARVR